MSGSDDNTTKWIIVFTYKVILIFHCQDKLKICLEGKDDFYENKYYE